MQVHQMIEVMAQAQQIRKGGNCDRGQVGAVVYDNEMTLVSGAANTRPGKCDCNDGVDTNVEGSKTCQAVHAEARIISYLSASKRDTITILGVTRPPCKACADLIEKRLPNLEWLITTNEYGDRDGVLERWNGKLNIVVLKEGQY